MLPSAVRPDVEGALAPVSFDTGAESCPQGQLPGPATFSEAEARNASNPLQYVPGVGMIYRLATGESVPPPLQIAGAAAAGAVFGGPFGVIGALAWTFLSELVRLGPDTSRPPTPEGMDVTGSETAMRPVTPGTITTPNGYTTLATTLPDFLGGAGPMRQALAAYTAGAQVGAG